MASGRSSSDVFASLQSPKSGAKTGRSDLKALDSESETGLLIYKLPDRNLLNLEL